MYIALCCAAGNHEEYTGEVQEWSDFIAARGFTVLRVRIPLYTKVDVEGHPPRNVQYVQRSTFWLFSVRKQRFEQGRLVPIPWLQNAVETLTDLTHLRPW